MHAIDLSFNKSDVAPCFMTQAGNGLTLQSQPHCRQYILLCTLLLDCILCYLVDMYNEL